jgi:hypothetical protein
MMIEAGVAKDSAGTLFEFPYLHERLALFLARQFYTEAKAQHHS